MKPYRYYAPTEVRFGAGSIALLPELTADLKASKPLIVTGSASARRTGLLDTLLKLLPTASVFEGVEENPSNTTCDAGAATCREQGCDLIIAVGGGSPLDAAKAIAMLATNEGNCADFYGYEQYPNPALPLIAIPTTAGTGSECTQYAIITDKQQNAKFNLSGRDLFPKYAVLDPELTYSLPRNVTLATGLDALSQGMEGYVALNSTPPGDALALEVCRLVYRWLPVAVEEPKNLEARSGMLHAAMLSGMVIAQSGTTLVHGAGYALTTQFGVAHGVANALLLPPLFEHNARHLPEKVAALAGVLGTPCPVTPDAAEKAITHSLYSFYDTLKFDPAGKNHGILLEPLEDFALTLAQNPLRLRNQVGDLGAKDIYAFYEMAYSGQA